MWATVAVGLTGLHLASPPMTCPPTHPADLDLLRQHAPAVQLWMSPIGYLQGRAVHPHFLYTKPGDDRVHRIEVWQSARGPHDHLFVDRIQPHVSQGRGSCLVGERTGHDALAVIDVLEAAPEQYTWTDTYLPVPGPNSNTFAATVLDVAGWDLQLPMHAVGQSFGWPFSAGWTAPEG